MISVLVPIAYLLPFGKKFDIELLGQKGIQPDT